jgi:type IV pilus assembly protein PilY1
MKRSFSIERFTVTGLMALTLGIVSAPAAHAAELALSDSPLFIDLNVDPNVVVTLDDSGSMRRCGIWDQGIAEVDIEDKHGMTSSEVNELAYNPNIEYVVPVDANNVSLGVPDFNNAWVDGYDQSGSTKNLSTEFAPCWSNLTNFRTIPLSAQAAYYHVFSGDPQNSADLNNPALFDKIVVGSASDTGGFGATATEKQQNFANWFSYYRNRLTTMKSSAGRGFTSGNLESRIRIAYQTLWGLNADETTRGDISLTKPFEGQGRIDFFDWLYGIQNTGGTPLRYSLDKVGRYFQNQKIAGTSAGHGYTNMAAEDSPWAFVPGQTLDPELWCRQAFHVLLTDGAWNNDAGVSGNVDNTSANYPEVLENGDATYNPGPPYQDSNSDMLADTAFHYWITDLRTDLLNDVPTLNRDPTPHPVTGEVVDNPMNDPATWQHLVNFTVGFGVDGNRAFPGDYDNLLDGTLGWGGNKIDDLWHAALNSRGAYLNGKNPQELVDIFTVTLEEVLGRTSSGAAVSLDSASLSSTSRLYQARLNSGNWSGTVLAFDLDEASGAVLTPEVWDAGMLLTTKVAAAGWDTSRHVITFDGTAGIPFRWGSLPVDMQAELNKNGQGIADIAGSEQGQARLEYLRGSEQHEGTGNNYRVRSGGKLGDIVSSAPVFVAAPAFNYPDNLESASYSTFRTAQQNRTPMVYVGANDGMLHGFNANDGQELIAYVPRAVYSDLTRLTALPYPHRFYVDGPPTVGDVFYASAWHTVLVGGLRKGAQAIYALDVTDPASFSEANAASLALWEFNDADDPDLGYTYSRPAVVRMANGRWAAVFGNGYNNTEADGNASTSGNAVLFVVDIEDGSLIQKIDTSVGTAADPSGANRPNGLATPAPVDVNGDRIADYIYAGDLFGNMWKFDVRDASETNWGVAYGGSPLYVAKDAGGTVQPITTRPEVSLHPAFQSGSDFFANGGYLIYFGTGQYLEPSDNLTTGAQTQTFYGVWDPDKTSLPPALDRSNLLAQLITDEGTVTVNSVQVEARLTTNNGPINWRSDPLVDDGNDMGWFMDLINTGAAPLDNQGERQVTTPLLRADGRIVFTTLIPSGSNCLFGGSGWLMELDATDGSRLGDPPFDFDNDGVFDVVDFGVVTNVVPSGVKSTGGAPATPAILPAGDNEEYKYISGTDAANIQVIHEKSPPGPPGSGTRESWREIQ